MAVPGRLRELPATRGVDPESAAAVRARHEPARAGSGTLSHCDVYATHAASRAPSLHERCPAAFPPITDPVRLMSMRDGLRPLLLPEMPDSAADAMECERITRLHARTFALASRLLPAPKRRAAYALYAFCRVADDLVDQGLERRGDGVHSLRAQLRAYEQELKAALDGKPSGPIFREVARVIADYDVPSAPLFELLAGVACDLDVTHYQDWQSLDRYCQGVASSVGEMCTHVFGVVGGPAAHGRAIRHARTLGVAMQLTNILRDVGEDAKRGRCYLPLEDLAQFGFDPRDILEDPFVAQSPRWASMMAHQVTRARTLYAAAMPGIALLAPDSQRCAAACATGYAGILTAIEAQGYDTISTRARLGRMARVGILWDAWRYRAPGFAGTTEHAALHA
jgi:phytoene synthase